MAPEADSSPDQTLPSAPPADTAGAPPAVELRGRKLGQYVLQEKIGQGGMGLVYRAFDSALERTVAVKILPISALDDPRQSQRFMREARSLARLQHPNLLHVYNVGQEKDCYYFAMELLQGETLFAAVQRRQRIPAPELVRFMGQILSALHYVHAHGIMHRDIKSGNLMLCEHRGVLMDFGLAKDEHYSGLTSVGVMLGTPDYMSPEAAEGQSAGPATDIYSVGVVFYEALSGKLPFTGRSAMSIIRQHLESPPPRLERVLPDIDPRLAKIVYRCLEKKATDRYPDCVALAEDLALIQSTPELSALAASKLEARERGSGMPPTIPSKVPNLAAFPDSQHTLELTGSALPARPKANFSAVVTASDLDSPGTLLATRQLEASADSGREWPTWVWIAIGFFGFFILLFILAVVFGGGKHKQAREGQPAVFKRRDGTGGTEFRWIEFRGSDPDPANWEHIIELKKPDGTWERTRMPHRDFVGRYGEIIEFPAKDTRDK